MGDPFHSNIDVGASPYQVLIEQAVLLPPNGYGDWEKPAVRFHNTEPKTRAQRRHFMNREEVERARLRERREGFTQYTDPGALIRPDRTDNALYMADRDRFFTDTAAEQRDLKKMHLQQKQEKLFRLRDEALRKEEERWNQIDAEARAWDERTAVLQADGKAALKNKSGAAFNPVSQAYDPTPDGEALRRHDDLVKTRAIQRATFLAQKSNGSGGYNPLTGAPEGPLHYIAPLAVSLGVADALDTIDERVDGGESRSRQHYNQQYH